MTSFHRVIHVPNWYITVNKNELQGFGSKADKSPDSPLCQRGRAADRGILVPLTPLAKDNRLRRAAQVYFHKRVERSEKSFLSIRLA